MDTVIVLLPIAILLIVVFVNASRKIPCPECGIDLNDHGIRKLGTQDMECLFCGSTFSVSLLDGKEVTNA